MPAPLLLRTVLLEWFAGVGTMSHAFRHHGVRTHAQAEQDELKQRVLRHFFPLSVLVSDVFDSFLLPLVASVLIAAGIPCQPVAPGGYRLAHDDPRAFDMINAIPGLIARLGNRYVSLDVEEHADLLSTGADILARIDSSLLALEFPLVRSPALPDMFNPVFHSGKIQRRRLALRWELRRVVERIGPAPPLRPIVALPSRIANIALPSSAIRPEQYVHGRLRLLNHCVSLTSPTVCAKVVLGGLHVPLFKGSRVHVPDLDFQLVLVALPDDPTKNVLLMHDVRGAVKYYPHYLQAQLVHDEVEFDVLSMDGVAASCTKMGVPPLGSAKQLWLRDGRAYAPDFRELCPLLECSPSILFPLCDDVSQPPADIDAIVGDMLTMQLAEAQAHRSVTRESQYDVALALDDAVARGDESLEAVAAARFAPLAYANPSDTFVVLVTIDDDGTLRAFVSADKRQLPRATRRSATPTRDARVDIAKAYVATLPLGLGFEPHAFNAFSTPYLSCVAIPALGYSAPRNTAYSQWCTIDELADSDIYLPLSSAFSRVSSHAQRGMPIALCDVKDGALSARPLLQLPTSPSSNAAAWPLQLQFLETVDSHLRCVLGSPSQPVRYRDYLRTWIDQADTTPNADVPPTLRGVSMKQFESKELVGTKFYDPCPIDRLDPPTFPTAQVTAHKPTKITHILKPWAIRHLARKLKPIIAVMKLQRDGKPVPESLMAQCSTIVIGQDGFVDAARGVVWDLRSRHPDGHFLPLAFDEPITSHLDTDAMFTALGDDYPDQSLRHQVKHGALFFASLELQIVVCPHLVSLGDAFQVAERDLFRLARLGYLEVVESEHFSLDDDSELIMAFGLLPIRCTSQGTRARKLQPEKPRRIANGGGPHKKLVDGLKQPVVPLNVAINFRSVVDGVRKFPRETKPLAPGVMTDIAILQTPARILHVPVLQFNDDSSDAFNQLMLHRSQIWMTSVLWLKINSVASRCEYGHILENSFGFGYSCASGFCQRFGVAMMWLVTRAMRQAELPIRSTVTDPSLLEWFRQRDALGDNESDLFRCHIFTDDPQFMAVGFDRLVRLICCWRDVTVMIGLRMAIAAKRQCGTSILWTGLRYHGAIGAVVIPPQKRSRAISELVRMKKGEMFRVDDAMSIAGLLEHLTPFANELRSAMYHFYYPHKAFWALGMAHEFPPTDAMRSQAARWVTRLSERAGVSCLSVLKAPLPAGGALVVMSSDAAKDGTPTPGIGGHCHGASWYVPLRPEDVVGPLQLPINWLEFVGIYGNVLVFGPSVDPTCTRVLMLTDSLTSALVLTRHSARSEGMQLIHRTMLDDAEFQRILHVLQIAHVFGSANVFADAVSRGYFSIVEQLCRQVATRHEWLDADGRILALLAELRVLALAQRTAADERAVSPPAAKKLKTRRSSALEQSRTAASSDNNMGDGPSTSQPAGQSSAEHDDRPSTAYLWERLVQCTTPGCDRACDPNLLARGSALCCEICGVPHVRHTIICDVVHSSPLPAFALPLRQLEPRRPRRISDASVPRVSQLGLIANDQLPDLVAPPIVAENLVEAARGVVWDLVVATPIVAVNPLAADMPGGGPAMHPDAGPDVLIDYDNDEDDNDVWARVFGGPPLQTVTHTASTANAAVDAVSRRPLTHMELGLDSANSSNSMGDGPTGSATGARPRSPPARLQPRAKRRRVSELIAYEEHLMMEFLAGDTFREERYFSLHPVLAHELMMSAPATAPPLPPTPAPEPPSPPTAAIPPPAADATASAATAVADAVRSRPLSPNELGLDSANSGNSMGDGPTQRPTAFPRFGTRNVSSPTVVVARPGQFLSFATPTPVPVLGGTPHRYRSPSPTTFAVPPSPRQAARAPNVFPTFVPARSRRESRFPPSYPARQIRAQLSSATQASSRFVITPQQGRRPPPISFAARCPTVASPNELHVVPPARGASSRPAPSAAQAARDSSLLDVLMSDTSRYALCPNDPGMLAALVRDVGGVVDASVKANTAKKDRSAMRKWRAFCRLLNTSEVRDCLDAHSGADPDGARRERFLQAAFFLWAFRSMIPRNRAHLTAKPASARSCVDAVRRVHKLSDIVMAPAPSVNLVLKGLMFEYIRLHGKECLVPKRREPLTNTQIDAILSIPNGTRLGRYTVDWNTPLFRNFRAFLPTLRDTGSRKADLLDVTPRDFDNSSMSKLNIKWFINGVVIDAPDAAALRALGPGDAAVIIPGCTKADPFAIMFGDKPMYLEFDPTDRNNAALNLRDLELAFPVPPERRRSTPLFCSDDCGTPMSHEIADVLFHAACALCFTPSVANALSLHSGRVWLACALLASDHQNPTIQAMCRWLSPAAVRIYAHMNPEQYMRILSDARSANVTSRLATNIPVCDGDGYVQAIRRGSGVGDSPCPPSPPRRGSSASPRQPAAAPDAESGEDDDDGACDADEIECDVETSGMCDAGHVLDDDEVVVGARVAVPFTFRHHAVHFEGVVVAVSDDSASVSFPDERRPWNVQRDRLFAVLRFEDVDVNSA